MTRRRYRKTARSSPSRGLLLSDTARRSSRGGSLGYLLRQENHAEIEWASGPAPSYLMDSLGTAAANVAPYEGAVRGDEAETHALVDQAAHFG